jgi:hypothetical protein
MGGDNGAFSFLPSSIHWSIIPRVSVPPSSHGTAKLITKVDESPHNVGPPIFGQGMLCWTAAAAAPKKAGYFAHSPLPPVSTSIFWGGFGFPKCGVQLSIIRANFLPSPLWWIQLYNNTQHYFFLHSPLCHPLDFDNWWRRRKRKKTWWNTENIGIKLLEKILELT